MSGLSLTIKQTVPSVAKSLAALRAMERELSTTETYEQIKRTIKAVEALTHFQSDIAEVKAAAEDAILIGNRRIAEELPKVPKATHRGGLKKQFSGQGKSVNGRAATSIKPTSLDRLGKLAQQSPGELKATVLREHGKDATVTAVVREIAQRDGLTALREAAKRRRVAA